VLSANSARASTELDWLIPVSAILAIELLLWFLSYSAGLAYAPQITAYGVVAYSCMTLVLAYHCLALLYRTRGQPPLSTLTRTAFSDWRRLVFLLVALQIVALGSSAFGALKAAMPKTVPFWLDQPLYRAEAYVFGAPPWQWTQYFLGWATPGIELIYSTFVPTHLAATFAVVFLKPSPLKTRALVSLFLIWLLLGIVAAYALSSAGPIFYDRVYGGDTVAGLNDTLRHAPIAVRTADSLWMLHELARPAIGNGLSAMPSMHVGLTLWLALVLRKTRAAPLAWTYFALIFLGSVHLGWHYVSDGLVASLGVLCIWRALRPGGAITAIENRQARGIVFGPA
jgi:hypothetical protein